MKPDSITGIYLDDGSDYYTIRGNLVEKVGDYLYNPTITRDGIPGIPIKHRHGNMGENNQYLNNEVYKVVPKSTLEVLGTPINAATIDTVKTKAGLTPEYQDIKEYLNGKRPN